MTFRHTMTALAVVLAAGAAGSAMADEAALAGKLDKVDQNKDGVISMQELRANGEAWFQAIDADGDGEIDQSEMQGVTLTLLDANQDDAISEDEFMRSMQGRRVDVDQDEMVSQEEAAAHYDSVFAMLDEDGDGTIGQEEWNRQIDFSMADLDDDADGTLSRVEFMGHGEEAYGQAAAQGDVTTEVYWQSVAILDEDQEMAAWSDRFASLDEDDDGTLSRQEWEAAGTSLERDYYGVTGPDVMFSRDEFLEQEEMAFAEADLDGDGEVTVWEYRAYR